MICTNCNHPIEKLKGRWWHAEKWNNGTSRGLFFSSFCRETKIEKHCKECGHSDSHVCYCEKPEPIKIRY